MTNGLLLYHDSKLYSINECGEYKSINEELEKECMNVHFQTSEEFFKEITSNDKSSNDDLFNICILNDSENRIYEIMNINRDKIPLNSGRFADKIDFSDMTNVLSSIIETYSDMIIGHICSNDEHMQKSELYSKLLSVAKLHDDNILSDNMWLICEEIDNDDKAKDYIYEKYVDAYVDYNLTEILEEHRDRDEVMDYVGKYVEERVNDALVDKLKDMIHSINEQK